MSVTVQEKRKSTQCLRYGGQEETLSWQQTRNTTDHKIKTFLEHFVYQLRSENDLIQAIKNPSVIAIFFALDILTANL